MRSSWVVLTMSLVAACGGDDDSTSGVTIELPASVRTRPGKRIDVEAYVRGTTRWDKATCTVSAGSCTIHVIEPQHFRLSVLTPRMLGSMTLTVSHDGEGGTPGSTPVPVSANTEIVLEGRAVPPYLIPTPWQDSEHVIRVNDIAFSADGARVASSSLGSVKIHDWASARPLASLPVGYPESEVFVVDSAYPAEAAEFVPGDASVLVGTYAYVLRLNDTSGEELGRVKLDDLPGHQAFPVVRDLSCHTGSGRCVAVRAPRERCDDVDCYSGLYVLDDPKAPAPTARTLATSNPHEIWSRVALSPSGTQVAILHEPDSIRVFDVESGAEVQRITDSPDAGDYLAWTSNDRIVTSRSTFAPSGARLGEGVVGPRALAVWNDQRRASMYGELAGFGRMRFADLPAGAPRYSTGFSGQPVEMVVARDAPYLAVQVANDGSQTNDQLRIYDTRDGSVRRVVDVSRSGELDFDMCVDGRLVFRGADARVYTAVPADDFVPVLIDVPTLSSPISVLQTPPTGITYDCRALMSTGSEQSAVVNLVDRAIEIPLGFAATHAAFGDVSAEPYTISHYFSAPTLFGAPPRIYDAAGTLTTTVPGNIVRWSRGGDTIHLFDDTGRLTGWNLPAGTAGASVQLVNAANADRSFYLPPHRIGPLMLAAGQQLRVDAGASDHLIDLTHGAAIPRMVIEAHDRIYVIGDSFILAHPSTAIHDRVLEIIDP